jgi:nitrate reductase delta subunit
MSTMSITLRALAALLCYPDAELRAHLHEVRSALRDERALSAARLAQIERLLSRLAHADPLQAEAEYVDTFDRGRSTALHLFEHVHGDSRDRGPAMIDLTQTYARAGLCLNDGELPDFLPVALEFVSTQPPQEARAFLGEIAHIVRSIFSALLQRRSAYAGVLAAVLDLAGERAERVALPEEPALDDSWAEPEAFSGCTSHGQMRPGRPAQPQPITIHRSATNQAARNDATRNNAARRAA